MAKNSKGRKGIDFVTLAIGGTAAGIVLNEAINFVLNGKAKFEDATNALMAGGAVTAIGGAFAPKSAKNILVPAGAGAAIVAGLVRFGLLPIFKFQQSTGCFGCASTHVSGGGHYFLQRPNEGVQPVFYTGLSPVSSIDRTEYSYYY